MIGSQMFDISVNAEDTDCCFHLNLVGRKSSFNCFTWGGGGVTLLPKYGVEAEMGGW